MTGLDGVMANLAPTYKVILMSSENTNGTELKWLVCEACNVPLSLKFLQEFLQEISEVSLQHFGTKNFHGLVRAPRRK